MARISEALFVFSENVHIFSHTHSPKGSNIGPAAKAPEHALLLKGPVCLGQFQFYLLEDIRCDGDSIPDRSPWRSYIGVHSPI